MGRNQRRISKIIKGKSRVKIKNDSCDTLIYLIYLDYLNRLINESTHNNVVDLQALKQQHEILLKTFRG